MQRYFMTMNIKVLFEVEWDARSCVNVAALLHLKYHPIDVYVCVTSQDSRAGMYYS